MLFQELSPAASAQGLGITSGADAADLPAAPLGLARGRLTPRRPSRIRHTIGQTIAGGTGMLTRCPSTTPFGLALGPD